MDHPIADDFRSDPRVRSGVRVLLEALAEHQAKLNGVRPPRSSLQVTYEQALEAFSEARGGKLYYPYLGSGLGRGALVELADGSVKYDFIGGIGVHYFGHSHPDLVRAALHAALQDTLMQGNLQQNAESIGVAQTLLGLARAHGAPLAHCFLTSSGAMANENALKMIFHRQSPARRVLAFRGCFCGRTMALASITDKPAYRAGLPRALSVDYVPFFDARHPQQSTTKAVDMLKRHLNRHPSRHALMVMELVLGEGGYYPGDHEFFIALMDVLRDAGVPVLIDEIQTFGRTTAPFAFQHFGLDERVQIVTVGKMTQLCATLFAADFKPPPGLVSQTFTASTSAIFAAAAILDRLSQCDLFGPEGRVAQLSNHFVKRLEAAAARHPRWLKGPFGFGAMIAFTPLDGKPATIKKLLHALFDAGVIAFVAGTKPARIRFLPPMGALTETDIDAVCEIVEKTLGEFQSSAAPFVKISED